MKPDLQEPTPEQRFQAYLAEVQCASRKARPRDPWWLKLVLVTLGLTLWIVILAPLWRG